jgi:hypothetical protein
MQIGTIQVYNTIFMHMKKEEAGRLINRHGRRRRGRYLEEGKVGARVGRGRRTREWSVGEGANRSRWLGKAMADEWDGGGSGGGRREVHAGCARRWRTPMWRVLARVHAF